MSELSDLIDDMDAATTKLEKVFADFKKQVVIIKRHI